MTWETDYKLALLRAANVEMSRLKDIDMSTVEIEVYGNAAYSSGCDTCGSFAAVMSIELMWVENGRAQRYYLDGEGLVSNFIRKVLAP